MVGVVSSCTLASRGSAAGSELAVMDVEDTPRQYIKALALGVRGKVVRGGFAFCGFHCASVVCKTSTACVVTSQQRVFWIRPPRAHVRQCFCQ